MNELLPVLRLAKEKGLKLSLHLAEVRFVVRILMLPSTC